MYRFVLYSILAAALLRLTIESLDQVAAKPGVATCPLTLPNGSSAPGIGGAGGYGDEVLWTNLYMWSNAPVVVVPNDGRVFPEGSINDMK